MAGKWGPGGLYELVKEQAAQTAVAIASGGGGFSAGPFDMRGFNGWYLRQEAATTGANAYNAIRANMIWSAFDETQALTGGLPNFRRDFEWWASTGSPGAGREGLASGFLGMQGKCLGPTLNISYSNQGTTNAALTWALFGTSREFEHSFQSASPYDDLMYENSNIALGAGAGYEIPLPQFYGRLQIHRECIGAGSSSLTYIRWGSAPSSYAYHDMASSAATGNPQNFEIVAPARPALITVTAGAAAVINRIVVVTQRDKI